MATGRKSMTVATQYYVYRTLAIDNIHRATIKYNTIHLYSPHSFQYVIEVFSDMAAICHHITENVSNDTHTGTRNVILAKHGL
jgi:hypothetical protein